VRKIIPAVIAGATVLAVAGGTFVYATLNKDVTLSVDGEARNLSTAAGNVSELLRSEGIEIGDHDVVAPGGGTALVDGTRVVVQFGRQVKITVDGKAQSFWTTATTVDAALATRHVNTTGADLSTSRSTAIGREGLSIDLATRKTVSLTAGGATRSLNTTAMNVSEALTQAKAGVDADDFVRPAAGTKLTTGMKLQVVEVDVANVTKRKAVDYDTVYKNTGKLMKGNSKVDTRGKSGTRTLVYREVRHDGTVKSRQKISSKITKQPTDKVVLVGTKKPKPAVDTSNGGSSNGGGSTPSNSVWDRLAQCETGQRWNTDSVPGYSGGLGFAHSSWRAYGGSGSRAAGHSREEQIAVAKRILADVGWGAWPACSIKLGLR
jgi:resuscitation-promoting factor RpfB